MSEKAGKGYGGKVESEVYWICFLYTLYHIFSIFSVSFGMKEVSSMQTSVYGIVLTVYVALKRTYRWGQKNDDQNRGEYFVYLLWLGSLGLFIWQRLSPDHSFIISNELKPTIEWAAEVFFGSAAVRYFGPSIHEHFSKKQEEGDKKP